MSVAPLQSPSRHKPLSLQLLTRTSLKKQTKLGWPMEVHQVPLLLQLSLLSPILLSLPPTSRHKLPLLPNVGAGAVDGVIGEEGAVVAGTVVQIQTPPTPVPTIKIIIPRS